MHVPTSMCITSLSQIPTFIKYYFKFGGLYGTQLRPNWWENNTNFFAMHTIFVYVFPRPVQLDALYLAYLVIIIYMIQCITV